MPARNSTRSRISYGLRIRPSYGIAEIVSVRDAMSALTILRSAGGVPVSSTTSVSVSPRSVPSAFSPFFRVIERCRSLELRVRGHQRLTSCARVSVDPMCQLRPVSPPRPQIVWQRALRGGLSLTTRMPRWKSPPS